MTKDEMETKKKGWGYREGCVKIRQEEGEVKIGVGGDGQEEGVIEWGEQHCSPGRYRDRSKHGRG